MQRYFATIIFSTLPFALLACASRSTTAPPEPAANKPQEKKMEIKLESSAFKDGQSIPKQYTCDGVNISPPLEWSGVPKNGKTLAIICDDPDAPAGTWVHWVVYNLPADDMGLIENTPATDKLTGGGLQGKNDFGKIGYGGPCPPSGTHRYFFKLYALDAETDLKPGATKSDLLKAMEGHIVAQGELMGTYSR
jgi:Raf kinase inhibitor-like YbhB/YbcL family protein